MINQVEVPYQDESGEMIAATNPQIKELYDQVTTASVDDGLSAGLVQWSPDWNNGFQQDSFATMLCPGWMLGIIEGNAEGVEGWDVANVFPGGAGNWGGSYLTVPAQGDNIAEAKALAEWLTHPDQQIKAFEAKGTFPSQVEALESETLLSSTNAFFDDAPTGQIFADRAKAITFQPYKGPDYFSINTALGGDGQVGAAPVACSAGEDVGHVPTLDALGVAFADPWRPRPHSVARRSTLSRPRGPDASASEAGSAGGTSGSRPTSTSPRSSSCSSSPVSSH
jgi:hypothetical protein